MPTMTPEEEARIRELPKLIADEIDPEKVTILAAELERLLNKPRPIVSERPLSG